MKQNENYANCQTVLNRMMGFFDSGSSMHELILHYPKEKKKAKNVLDRITADP